MSICLQTNSATGSNRTKEAIIMTRTQDPKMLPMNRIKMQAMGEGDMFFSMSWVELI